jgi:hypothetical protein
MKILVFLLEEPSMEEVLKVLLPKILPNNVYFQLVPHEGKSDLDRSIPKKLRAWRAPGVRFVIVRDRESAECKNLKRHLLGLCEAGGRPDSLIRIVCPSLEAWFLGDLEAVEQAFELNGLTTKPRLKRFADPDHFDNAPDELRRMIKQYKKLGGARAIAPHLDAARNRSHSFGVFRDGVLRFARAP